jgi:hypothetical protein
VAPVEVEPTTRIRWHSSLFGVAGLLLFVVGVLWLLGTAYVASQEVASIMQQIYILLSWVSGFAIVGLSLVIMLLDSVSRSLLPPGERSTKTSGKRLVIAALVGVVIFVAALAAIIASVSAAGPSASLTERDNAPRPRPAEPAMAEPADAADTQSPEQIAASVIRKEVQWRLKGAVTLVNEEETAFEVTGERVFVMGDVSHRPRGEPSLKVEPYAALVMVNADGKGKLTHLTVGEETLVGQPWAR